MLSDFPGMDIELSGIGYQTLIPFALDPTATKVTEPFMPFGGGLVPARTIVKAPTPANPIQGIIAGGGTVYSFDTNAKDPTSTMRLEAWGMRNPYGIGFDPFDPKLLFISNNGADIRQTTINGKLVIRGSRPIDNDFDDMFVVNIGKAGDADEAGEDRDSQGKRGGGRQIPFFGHPDYFHDPVSRQPLPVTNPLFCPAGLVPPPPPVSVVKAGQCSQFAFSDQFRATLKVQPAFAQIELHSSANMFDFSRTERFGFKGDIFIAETGSIPPGTGATDLNGFKVARIDRKTGVVSDFITHLTNTTAVIFPTNDVLNSFNKPIDVRFRGPEMFIVDFGFFVPGPITPNSGKVWKVTPLQKEAGGNDDRRGGEE
jgi:hypothetical protein